MQISGLHTPTSEAPTPTAQPSAPQPEAGRPSATARPAPAEDMPRLPAGTNTESEAPQPRDIGLRLRVDRELNRVVAQVLDRGSGEVIRQVPPEELLDLAKSVRKLIGLALDETA